MAGSEAERRQVTADVVSFARALRDAGLPVGVGQAEGFARALGWIDPSSRRELYLAARATLVCRREDMASFDAVFDAFWLGRPDRLAQATPRAPRHDPSAFQRGALTSFMAERARAADPEIDVSDRTQAASALELLMRKDFGALSDDERTAIEREIENMRFDMTRRRVRRRVSARRGDEVDLRSSLRSFGRHGVVLPLPRKRRKEKRRPLVVLADVSGSMELYARLLLQFLHGLVHAVSTTEVFVFGTRLTRITAELRVRNVDEALDRAASRAIDFGGGTRIGESLRIFNRDHARCVLRPGSVVLVVSDGWETGDVATLARELERIHARCHRLVWLNPLLGRAGYEPRTRGIMAVLDHLDDFLPVHNLESLKQLTQHLARLPARKGSAAPGTRAFALR